MNKLMAVLRGVLASSALLAIYFLVLTLVSGWQFALEQFFSFWYFIISLALGFGIQFGLYTYLKKRAGSGKVLATSGATSTAAMISCCAHYLTTVLPILGITGVIAFISQYQIQFFWIGLFFNLLGIFYIGNKVLKVSQQR